MSNTPALDAGPIAHLNHWAQIAPNSLALKGPNLSLSFAQLQNEVLRLAAWLRTKGLRGGVLINATQEYERIYALACLHEGLFSAGLPDQLTHEELRDLGFQTIISATAGTTSQFLTVLDLRSVSKGELESVDIKISSKGFDSGAVQRVIFSSGTTGKPKPTAFSAQLLRNRVEAAGKHYMRQAPFFVLVGFRTVAGNTCFFLDLFRGAVNLVPADSAWNAKQLKLMRVKGLMGSPVALEGVSKEITAAVSKAQTNNASSETGATLTDLDEVVSAGSFVSPIAARKLGESFGCKVTNVYGSTEAGLIAFSNAAQEPNDLCKLYPDVQVQILGDDGQILPQGEFGRISLRTPYMVTSYLGEPEEDGEFFEPGDIGALLGGRTIKISGREDDLINLSGFKIDPRPIESYVMNKHPGAEALCVLATDQNGRSFHLMLVASEEEIDLNALQVELLTVYRKAAPQALRAVGSLKRNEMGKVARRVNIETKKRDANNGKTR